MATPDYVKLKLPTFYSILGIFGTVGNVVFAVSQILTREPDQWLGIGGFALIFGSLSTYILLAGQVYNIQVDDNEVIQTTWLGRTRRLSWDDITNVTFGKISLELTLTDGTTKIKAHGHLDKFEVLVGFVEHKTGLKPRETLI